MLTQTAMKRAMGAAFLTISMATCPVVLSHAGVPLPVVEHAGGSLVPVLRKITPAVVSISVKGRQVLDSSAEQKKGRGVRHTETMPDRQGCTAGSGVIIDARAR
jgi:S1-C subfamily serine protease